LGITAIELAQGKAPYAMLSELDVMHKIQFAPAPTLKEPNKWPKLFSDFIASCLVRNPSER